MMPERRAAKPIMVVVIVGREMRGGLISGREKQNAREPLMGLE